MRQRPVACLALLVFLFLWLLPAGIFMEPVRTEGKTKGWVTGEVSRQYFKNEKTEVYLKNCTVKSDAASWKSKKLLVYLTDQREYPAGTILSLSGTIYPIEEPTNPGQFDSRLYYQGQGIAYTVYGESAQAVGEHPAPVQNQILRIQKKLTAVYEAVLPSPEGGLIKAMALGEKSDLDGEIKALYQKNGISHLLAISGLHVSLVGMGLYRLLRRLGAADILAGIPTILFLWAYGWMTGGSVSAVRAVLMCSLMILAKLLGRTYDMPTAIGAAALAVMLRNPLAARQSAFLLSFGAVLAIALVQPLWRLYRKRSGKILSALSVSLSVTLFTLPVLLLSFYEYPLYSTLLNLMVIPLMSILMACGLLCGLTGLVSLRAARIFAVPCRMILGFYERSGRLALGLPGAVLKLGSPEKWKVLLYYGVLLIGIFLLYRQKRRKKYWRHQGEFRPSRKVLAGSVAAVLACVLLFCVRIQTGLEVTMLDVGQGDAIFFRDPAGTTFLMDAGSSNVSGVGSYRILPFLKYEGVRTLDYLLISHMDQDHISAVEELIEESRTKGGIGIGHAVLPLLGQKDEAYQAMEESLQAARIPILYMKKGDALEGKTIRLSCLWPASGAASDDRNDLSLVLEVEYKNFQMLLTGDISSGVEKRLALLGDLEQTEVLKVAHHGSKYSSSAEFLSALSPRLSLISCSAGNRYGHPGAETLKRLENAGSGILVTKDCGAIMLWTDGRIVRASKIKS